MTGRGLLRIALLLALVPLLLRTQVRTAPIEDEGEDADIPMDPDFDGDEGLIDINTASRDVLATLPGIGAAHADAIVQNRPYRAKLDLLRRGIISEAAYRTIRDQVIARHRSLEHAGEEIESQGHA